MKTARFAMAIVMFAIAVLSIGHAHGQETAQPTVIEIGSFPVMDESGEEIPGQLWLMANLTTEDGRYVGGQQVEFSELVDFFGPREAIVAKVVTDGTGLAAVVYQPSGEGEHSVIATFAGDREALYAPSSETILLTATGPTSLFPSEDLPLESVGTWLAVALLILGIVFWLVLSGVLIRTVRTIKRESPVPITS